MALLVDRFRADKRALRVIRESEHAPTLEWMLRRDVPVYEVSNVARYLSENDVEYAELTAFPNVAPPHRMYWMEWGHPERVNAALQRSNLMETPPDRIALLFWEEPPPAEGVWRVGAHALGQWRNEVRWQCSWLIEFYKDSHPVVIERHPIRAMSHNWWPKFVAPGAEDRQLKVRDLIGDLADEWGLGEDATEEEVHAKLNEIRGRAEQLRAKKRALDTEIEGLVDHEDDILVDLLQVFVLHPALMAHSLLACRNVETIDNRPSAKLSRAFQRRTGGDALVMFKTLKVNVVGGGEHHPGGSGFDRRLHIVRGHFKTYTADRPLLGRHVGTYWWTPGVRGKAERGVVVKDYEVSA